MFSRCSVRNLVNFMREQRQGTPLGVGHVCHSRGIPYRRVWSFSRFSSLKALPEPRTGEGEWLHTFVLLYQPSRSMRSLVFNMNYRSSSNKDFKSIIESCSKLTDIQKDFLLRLTDEQRNIVCETDSSACLARSAAGSGKTTTLVAKYLFLTKVKNIPPCRVHYLSYNKKNVRDVKEKLCELGINEDESEMVATTFHSLALKIIATEKKIWPELIEDVKWRMYDDEFDHSRAQVFLYHLKPQIESLILNNKSFKDDLINAYISDKKGHHNQYLCNKEDKNHIPGSCRSIVEKEVFDFLASSGVSFAYEQPIFEIGCRPDFTIDLPDGEVLYYEHYASFDDKDDSQNKETYLKAKKKKEKLEQNAKHFFSTSGGNSKVVINQLREKLLSYGVKLSEERSSTGDFDFEIILENVIKLFCDIRATILETDNSIEDIVEKYSKQPGSVGFFFRKIYNPLEKEYGKFLDSELIYTDFSDSLLKAVNICSNPSKEVNNEFTFDYVLVDEFQDISKMRSRFLKSLRVINPNMKILAVGDDWQSIYGFSSSDLSLFYGFEDQWKNGKSSSEIKDMHEVFRFGEPLSSVASSFVRKDKKLTNHSIVTNNTLGTQLFFIECDDYTQWPWIRKEIDALNSLFDSHEETNTDPDKFRYLILSRFDDKARGIQDWLRHYNGCTCSTIHSAKGKQADYVFILDCQSLPYVKNTNRFTLKDKIVSLLHEESKGRKRYKEKENEERRLFYVAMTRAKMAVYFLYWNGRKQPSRKKASYMDEIKHILKQQGIAPATIKVTKNSEQTHPLYLQTTDRICSVSNIKP